MKRAGIFFLLVAALAAIGRVALPLARSLVITREENPAAGMDFTAEALPLTGAVLRRTNEAPDGDAAAPESDPTPDEGLAALTEEILRLIYEVDGWEPEEAQMLESVSQYVTQPYFDYFSQVYEEKVAGCRRSFLSFELDEIRDETVRDAWGEYHNLRNVYARIHVGHDGRLFWITVKCVFKEVGDDDPPDRIMDQIFYVAG
jgi:hypothetical protein